jgi:Lipase (class 3)
VLDFVRAGISDFNAKNVIVTGHSQGAALGLLDTIFLAKHLDPSIKIKSVVFGLPRTGNKEWADFVDKTMQERKIDFQFFINDADPVPKVPPVELGFRHATGEVFQRNNTNPDGSIETLHCPGQENQNCSASISLLDSNVSFHSGPYAGVKLGLSACPL